MGMGRLKNLLEAKKTTLTFPDGTSTTKAVNVKSEYYKGYVIDVLEIEQDGKKVYRASPVFTPHSSIQGAVAAAKASVDKLVAD